MNNTITNLVDDLNMYGLDTQSYFNMKPMDIENLHNKINAILASSEAKATTKNQEVSEIIADTLKKIKKIYTIRNDNHTEIWIYENGIYVPNGGTFIEQFCRMVLKKAYSKTTLSLIKDKIVADTYIDENDFFVNNHINLIPVKQGLLDMFSREIKPFTDEEKFFTKLEIEYDPNADCPKIKSFLDSICEDKRDVLVLQELFGFLLLREYRIERCFMLIGSGRNGKSKVAELMKMFIGPKNVTNFQPSVFEDPTNFDISHLYGKLANLSIDINSTGLKNTSMLKSLSGRDLVTLPRKHKSSISFVNYAKLVFGANELPETRDTKDAFWERWILLEFPYTFVTKNVYDSLPEENLHKYKIRDEKIIDKITTEEEMQGLLNFALDGLKRLLEKKDFSYKFTPIEVKALWMRKSDSLNAFLLDSCEIDYGKKILKKDFVREYVSYCKKNRLKVDSKRMITTKLGEQGVVIETDRSNDQYNEYYDGVCLKDGGFEYIMPSKISDYN